MRIAMIGSGYVGLVSGACFSEFGWDVICVDKEETKIKALKQGQIPIFEPGLDNLVARNAEAGRLTFSTDLPHAVRGADVVFIAVGTPSRRGDGHADLTYVHDAAREIARAASGDLVVVNKSTVPVGTGDAVEKILHDTRPDLRMEVVSNPEFLREGSAIEDFMRPDRIVIGTESEWATEVMRQLYRPLYLIETPLVVTGRRTAEMIKYAANAFLATKITFINEVADLCEVVGADVHDVARGMGLDGRIGGKFLHPGPGFGGSCFPKDTLALMRTAREAGSPIRLVETVVEVNEARKRAVATRVIDACGGDLTGKTVAVLGLAFKPNTDDMRDAPSLDAIPALIAAGATIRAHDPEAMDNARALMPDITYCRDAPDTMTDAHILLVLTEWNSYRALQPARIKELMAGAIVVDMRNIFDPRTMAAAGLSYHGVGRPIPPTS